MRLIFLPLLFSVFAGCATQHSAHFDAKNIWHSVNDGNPKAVRQCLQSGASPNTHNRTGWSVLHEACWIRDPKIVAILVAAGADVNATGNNGSAYNFEVMWRGIPAIKQKTWPATRHATPLHTIISSGGGENERSARLHIVRILLAHGADPNIKTRDGFTVTALAAKEAPELLPLFR